MGDSPSKPRVLLLLPTATYRAPDFIAAASRLGVEVVVGSERAQALASSMGDRAVVVDLDHPDAAVAAIRAVHERAPLAAIVAVDDRGVMTAALAAKALGLRRNPVAAAAATRDKLALRTALQRAGLDQPAFARLAVDDDPRAVADAVGLPCVIKPIGLAASTGVIRVDHIDDVVPIAERVRGIVAAKGAGDADTPLIVENYVPGIEVAVEALVVGGAVQILAIFDKPDPLEGPYFEETIYVTPSRLPPAVQESVRREVTAAIAAIGLVEGPVHAEARIDGQRIVVLEVAARTIGGLCARTLRFGAGITIEELVLRHALGQDAAGLVPPSATEAAGVMMLPIREAGTLIEVEGVDTARAIEGIEGVEITIPRGRPVVPLPEGDRYLGFIFARAASPHQVEHALRQAAAQLNVVVDAGSVTE